MSAATVLSLDLRSKEIRANPWSVFKDLRERGPVIKIKMPFIGKSWAATSFESVNAVFKQDQNFVRNPKNAGRKNYVYYQWMLPRVIFTLAHNMLAADGVDHRRLRSVVDSAFARRNIDGMSERLHVLAEEQIDVADKIAKRDGQVDLIEHFARPFPLTAICELLGLPLADRPKFRAWFKPFATVSSIFGFFSVSRGLKKMISYMKQQFEIVRKHPGEGLMSEIVQIEHEGERLNEQELLSMMFLLLVAGHETTVHLISNSILTLLQHPAAKAELLGDWTKCNASIEEVLRYASPVQIAKPRYVVSDMEFFGQQLRRGEMITPLIASANYDPQRFENPDEFNINRASNYHMTFGSGPHTCLGIKLARTETQQALKGIFGRWPDLRAAFDLSNPDWIKRPGLRGMKTFMVKTS